MTQPYAKIIALVGLAGSGKSSAVEYLTEKGFPKIYFGGVIYKAMDEAGIEKTWDNQQQFREEIRRREGKDFVIKRVIKNIHDLINAGQNKIVLDGLYTWSEYKFLKHEFPGQVVVIAIVTPKYLRYQRMAKRIERPMQPHEVDQRDWSEIENLEKGGPIAIADYFIINDGSLEQLHQKIDAATHDVHFCKSPEQC
ncbi:MULTISPECIES: AAA family ATPase [unclassified Candidatus Nanosynbacter]|uniref:AAA family ATPase n=1 Tax=unclassified Candidatus Nanosynbacter TaxID=2725944 RepID=UPI001FB7C9DC|nr:MULTISPECIES: AAA family ATPase [unclassified Candidatus Nanosynbacter]MCJ1962994.1 AAA family ATPase [Candidatus Nanosynbacter sp. TM7-033]MCJ1967207.1 AAA family ATPase [Candidatus Nanosynbacter sp. TM7-075]UOG68192.1 AAA family ATPase [Candidatus Nanosynbacter sp. HMT-352]